MKKQTTNYILDTDIGTDVDDAIALVYLLKCQGKNVKVISTVINKAGIRAKIARKLFRILKIEVPIIAGKQGPKSAKKYWYKFEDKALTKEEGKEPMEKLSFPVYDENDVLVCIGPLTNIAWQLKHNPSIKNVKRIYVMGSDETGHNFKADKKSYQAVFQQPWEIYMIRKKDSKKICLTREEFEQFKGTKLGDFLYSSAIRWLNYSGKPFSSMYDVLTVSAAIGEKYVRFKNIEENRFVSCEVSSKLKKRILEVIKEN